MLFRSVSPHPEQAPENSNNGSRNWVPRTVPKSTLRRSLSGMVSKNLTASFSFKLNLPASVKSGILVRSVQQGMPADGKLQKNDVITKVDNTDVESTSDLQSVFYKHILEMR